MKTIKPAKKVQPKKIAPKKAVAKKPVATKKGIAKKVLSKKVTPAPVVVKSTTMEKFASRLARAKPVASKRRKRADAAKNSRAIAAAVEQLVVGEAVTRIAAPVPPTVKSEAEKVNDLKKRWLESGEIADKKAWKDAAKKLADMCKLSGEKMTMATPTLPPAEEWPGGRSNDDDGSMPFFVRGVSTPERNALWNLARQEGFKAADMLKGYSYPRSCRFGKSVIPLLERVSIALRYGNERALDEAVEKVAKTLFPGRFSLHQKEREEKFGVARSDAKKPRQKRGGRQLSEHDARLNDRARAREEKEKGRLEFLGGGVTAPKMAATKLAFRPKKDLGAEKMQVFRAIPGPARRAYEGSKNGNGNGAGVIKLADPIPVFAPPAPKPIAPKPETPREERKEYANAAKHCAVCSGELNAKEIGNLDYYIKVPVAGSLADPVKKFLAGEADRDQARRLCKTCSLQVYQIGVEDHATQVLALVKLIQSRGDEKAKAMLLQIAEGYRELFASAYAKQKVVTEILAVA